MSARKPAPVPAPDEAARLNEAARLHPWTVFDQGELRLMTRFPREAIQAAFAAPDFPSQFGKSRPEDVFRWCREQDAKIQTKEAKKEANL